MSVLTATPNLNFSHSPCRLRRLKTVQFGVFSPDSIRKGSVMQKTRIDATGEEIRAGVTKTDRLLNNKAVYGGLMDPRMGTSDRNERCKTCDCTYSGSGKMNDCPGHFGHIELIKPVFHCGFIDQVTRILRCVCHHCSRLLIDEKSFKDKKTLSLNDCELRLAAIHEVCKGKKRCETAKSGDIDEMLDAVGISTVDENGNANLNSMKNGVAAFRASSGCGNSLPKYTRKGLTIEIEYPDDMEQIPGNGDKKQKLSAAKAYEILRHITDDDVRKLGLNPQYARPEWLVISVLPVPPPPVRPMVVFDETPSEDDLTHALVNIVKTNNFLESSIARGDPSHTIEELEQLLTHHIATYFDNERADTARATQRGSGRPLKTITQRLKGKEGRLRGNLMGKRVDFSARTVITADPNLSIDQVGVPKAVAQRLTLPVVVTPFNKHELQELVEKSKSQNPVQWPGAMYIIRTDLSRVDLRYIRSENDVALEYGYVVERHLRDDDIVLFNRQPSLHKMSIMGHRAKVLDWSTFRLNLSVTTPYNADFDGDEMNLHVPQSINAKADAQELMMVPRNIVTPQNNRNVMGIVQDALLGVTRMTKRDVFIEKDVVMNTMMWIATWDGVLPTPAILKPRPLWTGKQLFSMICPKINYSGESLSHPKNGINPFNYLDSEVLIHSGHLLQGIVDKNIVGTSGGSVVHTVWLQNGWEETRNFMNQVQTVVNYWMVNTSYTVGIADTVADRQTLDTIQGTLNDAKVKVKDIMSRAQQPGGLIMQPGKPIMDSFEYDINLVLNNTRDTVGNRAQASIKERNSIKGTVMAGSKGSALNISQIIACVGQQNVQGKRIQYGFKQRTLPHFPKDDLGMESRGFVENSYLRGLTPQEFYFHAMCGREGVIDTAVKTSETGYIQRRLVKAMETVMTRYDTTLRNSRGCVMQFLYGEDNMDGQRIQKQKFDGYDLNRKAFHDEYYLDLSSDNFGILPNIVNANGECAKYLQPHIIDSCRNDPELHSMLDEEFSQLLKDREELQKIQASRGPGQEADASTYLPVNIDRLIWNAKRQFNVNNLEPTDLHPKIVIEKVKWIINELLFIRGDDMLSREAQANATLLFSIFVRLKLSCKRVLRYHRLNKAALDQVVGQIVADFHAAIVAPGETVGVLAAQSLGEPATQMTLNTFHNTGIGSKNVTLGVPRLNEILNVAKNIKTPYLVIYLHEANDQKEVEDFSSIIAYTTLGDLTLKTEIHYDPDPLTTVVEDDLEFVNEYFSLGAVFEEENPHLMSPWVLRLVLDPKKLGELLEVGQLDMDQISNKITSYYGSGLHVLSTDSNAENLVLRIRIMSSDEDKATEGEDVNSGSEDHELLRRLQKNLLDLHLFGVPGIKKAYFSKKDNIQVYSNEKGWQRKTEWVLETDGSNLAQVMIMPAVNHKTIVSNDLCEMFTVLGIEAARATIINEFRNALSAFGIYVNYRHLACLADCMTFGGFLMAISRHGINRGMFFINVFIIIIVIIIIIII